MPEKGSAAGVPFAAPETPPDQQFRVIAMRQLPGADTMNATTSENLMGSLRAFFSSGKTRPITFRHSSLNSLERMLRQSSAELCGAIREDLGKSCVEAYTNEIVPVIKEIAYSRRHLRSWSRPVRVASTPLNFGERGMIERLPYGVVLIISPWNYPVNLLLHPLTSALAAGNCVVLKPSEAAPRTAQLLLQLIPRYFSPDHVRIVTGGPETAARLINARPDLIFFTGGTATGRKILQAAAPHLIPSILELGGKNPCIVDSDIDLKVTVRRILWGKFNNAGQTCLAPDFAAVPQHLLDRFLEEAKRTIQSMFGSDPEKSPDYGRIINTKHLARLQKLLTRATVVHGGMVDGSDRYLSPTLTRESGWDGPLLKEEIFGPILPVVAYTSIEECLDRISVLPGSLAVFLFSRSRATIEKVRKTVRTANLCINGTLHFMASRELPFGGVGTSGMGRYHGKAGYEAFTYSRSTLHKRFRPDWPMYPPYRIPFFLMKRISERII